MKRFPVLAFFIALSGLTLLVAQEEKDKPAVRKEKDGVNESRDLPKGFPKGYEVDQDSISPNKKFAVIFPNPRAGFEDEKEGRNFLVALNPARILGPNEGFVYFGPHGSGNMAVEWGRDSSAALVLVGGKWGTIGATLFVMKDDKVAKRTDLMAEITKLLKTKFPKGKVTPYNDKLLIAPDGSDDWDFSEDGKEVRIALSGNTAPNLAQGQQWSASFKGTWSVPDGKWIQKEITSRVYTQK